MHLIISFILMSGTSLASEHWTFYARELIGETRSTRAEAVSHLKEIFKNPKDLVFELKGVNRALALDVMVAFNDPIFISPLLSRVSDDETGSVALAVNAFLSPESYETISQAYLKLIPTYFKKKHSITNLVVMLDFFSIARKPLPEEFFLTLLENKNQLLLQSLLFHLESIGEPELNSYFLSVKKRYFKLEPVHRPRILELAQSRKLKKSESRWVKFVCQKDSQVSDYCQKYFVFENPTKKPTEQKK
jgi:hypothetical protein